MSFSRLIDNNNNDTNLTETSPSKLMDGKSKVLRCLYTSIRSLTNNFKREEIMILINNCNLDVIALTESWTHDAIDNSELNFPGFSLFRKDRMNNKRRGSTTLC